MVSNKDQDKEIIQKNNNTLLNLVFVKIKSSTLYRLHQTLRRRTQKIECAKRSESISNTNTTLIDEKRAQKKLRIGEKRELHVLRTYILAPRTQSLMCIYRYRYIHTGPPCKLTGTSAIQTAIGCQLSDASHHPHK